MRGTESVMWEAVPTWGNHAGKNQALSSEYGMLVLVRGPLLS